ncbi:glutamate dehydrogenase [Pseudovirgaria hyperparasitica]|uniref:Glutamate dehydrogenase n=1 Tax=Pseudovirgaria hyperparasitica TaxID=470096 RepID=A0A6A6WCI5_9PEZI|nr:glutamate dehydrogenase [Pseudovirgaria hyperparasitica]KAF2759670.1 glutamate dehydrogenase [Pseudovirgaria hyperparasitica]
MSNLAPEPEFEQAYKELASTLENSSLFEKNPEYKKALEVAAIPERVIQFRVVWEDDKGQCQVNRGYRVQFNSALGPYKGGLRFHPTVNLSILKFLGFEQIFKNALTGLQMGGGKGGADFDPKGKSDNEIRKFCVAFMRELNKHIGADTDVPAGDIGVSPREIGWMFGTYRAERNRWEGVLTGKGGAWGGSLIRPEATGYGLVYYVEHMIKYASGGTQSFKDKRVAISGSGNVAQYAALKVIELGGTVVSLSDSKGCIVAPTDSKGFTPELIASIAQLKVQRKPLTDASHDFKYIEGARPWTHVGAVDVVLPSATQNEVSGEEAQALIAAGAKFIAEGSNMGCTQDAIDAFEAHRKSEKGDAIWYAPGKAANAGGVAVSGLEMAQNSARLRWSAEEVDAKLRGIMEDCFQNCLTTAKEYVAPAEGEFPSLVAGANIAGFSKVAAAMRDQGDWWSWSLAHRVLVTSTQPTHAPPAPNTASLRTNFPAPPTTPEQAHKPTDPDITPQPAHQATH